jgi:hypothetical protein
VFSEIFLVKIWEKFGIHVSKLLFKKKKSKKCIPKFLYKEKSKNFGRKKESWERKR